jgi:hypothetical protein
MRIVGAMQTAGHDKSHGIGSIVPALAKNARAGHPQFLNGKQTSPELRATRPPTVFKREANISELRATRPLVLAKIERAHAPVSSNSPQRAQKGTEEFREFLASGFGITVPRWRSSAQDLRRRMSGGSGSSKSHRVCSCGIPPFRKGGERMGHPATLVSVFLSQASRRILQRTCVISIRMLMLRPHPQHLVGETRLSAFSVLSEEQ